MKIYELRVPFAGEMYVSVEAETEKEAINKAFDAGMLLQVDDIEGIEDAEVSEWQLLKKIAEGNVLFAPLNNFEVTGCIEED